MLDFMIALPSTSPRPDSIWIIIDNQHLFCNYTLFTLPRSVSVFILITLFYTYHQRQLFPILVLNSYHTFWEIPCNLLLSPNWSEVQLIILEPTAKLKSGPNLKRHAKILHHSLWQPWRQMPVFSRVLTQLSSKLENGTIWSLVWSKASNFSEFVANRRPLNIWTRLDH